MWNIGKVPNKCFLTPREFKGLKFEQYVSQRLENLAIPYQKQTSKADFLLPCNIQLEAKFTHAKVFPSWVRRDWLTRFTEDATLKIVIANRGIKLTEEGKQLLKENSIHLIFYDEAYKLKSLCEWLRFLFGEEEVTRFIESNTIEKVYSVYSPCTVFNFGYIQPSPVTFETSRKAKLCEESIDVSVKPIRFAVFSVRKLLNSLKNWIGKLVCCCKKLRLPTHSLFCLERKNRIPERIWSFLAMKR